ncbi:Alpha/Beta hydrolase protein [Bombardia bombarda]|uniref:Alpha/Beta hydrolase protein n=1 Tax=Bombardia bombarda TaxID=252184 RepID=A0AA39X0G5_9PEZI|nr:Alpha/Beta hydrolase protein [Bombardia bombarda]
MALETRNFYPQLKRHVTPTSSGSDVVSYTSDLGDGGPILTLIHGYPQSAFIWRHIIPHLLPKVSLFVPELPGYGISTPCTAAGNHSKRTVGLALLSALSATFNLSSTSSAPRKVILGGHDRGARVCHRLAVDRHTLPSTISVIGTILLDIVPTKVQWDAFADPAIAQNYFHWPLLANVELAVPLIMAFGGANWVRGGHYRLTKSEEGLRRMTADDAVEGVYARLFEKEETVRGSCEDYKAGAKEEVDEQVEDQEKGRKLDVPVLVMFSEAGLGRGIDVGAVWRGWEAWDVVVGEVEGFLGRVF